MRRSRRHQASSRRMMRMRLRIVASGLYPGWHVLAMACFEWTVADSAGSVGPFEWVAVVTRQCSSWWRPAALDQMDQQAAWSFPLARLLDELPGVRDRFGMFRDEL